MEEQNGVSLGAVIALIKHSVVLANLGLLDIKPNADNTALIFYFEGGKTITLPITFLMPVAVYVDPNGSGVVRDSNLLGGKSPIFYTRSENINYDNMISGLTSANVKLAVDEIVAKLKVAIINIDTNKADIVRLSGDMNTLETSQVVQDNLLSSHTARLTSTEAETKTNNTTIANVIKGDYLSTNGKLQLTKNTNGVIIDSTLLQNDIGGINADLISHKTSSAAHFGVVEYKNEKGAISGYTPLDTNRKIPMEYLYTSAPTTAITTYPTNIVTTIANPQSNKYYYERANSRTDRRYPTSEAALTVQIPTATTTYADVGATLIDAGVLVGTFNNLTALSFIRYKCDMAGAKLKLEFYKRTSTGVETKIATSVEVNLQQSASFTSIETQSLFQSFSMTATDKIAMKMTVLKPVIGVLTFVTALGGQSPTYTSLVSTNGTGGSTTPIGINDVIGLPQVFDGSTAITDLKVTGQPYNLKDFMAFSRITNPNSIYVSSGSSNGTGDRFTPFGTLSYALAATSDTRKDIEIMDIGSYALPVNPDTTKVDNFMAHRAIITGDLVISKASSMYRIGTLNGNLKVNATNSTIMIDRMVGNIEISTNCVVIISGSFSGTITVIGSITPYIRINKINTTMTSVQIEALKTKLEAGSVFGKYIFNMVSVI